MSVSGFTRPIRGKPLVFVKNIPINEGEFTFGAESEFSI